MSPADEKELTIASLLYYQVYDQELPTRSYSKQDIEYIIQKLQQTIETGKDELISSNIH